MICSFAGEYAALSNFYPKPIEYNNLLFDTTEHAYQAAKTAYQFEQLWIQAAETPGIAKRRGRKVTLRQDWEAIKDQVMLDLLRLKFKDPVLAPILIATGEELLVEGNTWGDTYWGCCNGVGHNKLGELLMQVRYELQHRLER